MIEASGIHNFHIGVTLRLLEKALIEVGRAAIEPPPVALLTEYRDPIPQDAKGEVLAVVDELRRAIAAIVNELELPPQEESIRRTLLGNLHMRVVNISQLHADQLRGGGAVPPSLAEYIEPKEIQIETLLRRLIGLHEKEFQREKG